jgi:hypothetical protein
MDLWFPLTFFLSPPPPPNPTPNKSPRFMIPPPPPPPPPPSSSSTTLEGPATVRPPAASVEAQSPLSLVRPKMQLPPKVEEVFGPPAEKTGTDFLPAETLARAQKGSFLEKVCGTRSTALILIEHSGLSVQKHLHTYIP